MIAYEISRSAKATVAVKYLESEINHARRGNLLLYLLVNVSRVRENYSLGFRTLSP